jgi:hypothetical protein
MLPRLTTEFWVQALLRRCAGQGLFGAVLHSGNPEAGALMVVINHCNGGYTLLGPPPGPAFDEEGTRIFEKRSATPQSWPEIRELIERARSFDSDIWVVEIEDKQGFAGLL